MSEVEWVLWCVAFVVVAILIICGNLLTILVLTKASLIHTNLCTLLISLAVADLTVGSLAVPLFAYHTVAAVQDIQQSVVSRTLYQAIDIFTAYASIFSLIIIAIERLLAIAWPLKHQRISQETYLKVIAIVWILATILGCVAVLKNVGVISLAGFFIPVILCFFVSTVILCVSYIALWYSAWRIRNDQEGGSRVQEKRLGMTLLIVTMLFLAMWLPFQIVNLLFFSKVDCGVHCTFDLITFFKLLHYGNSFVNPIIYALRVPGFKKAAMRLIRRENVASITEEDITMNFIAGPASEA